MARYFSFVYISAVVRSSGMQLNANVLSTSTSDTWRDGPHIGSSGKLHCFAPGSGAGRSFHSLEKAQELCSNDSSCNFIWSRNCDGAWTTCEISVPVDSAGDESSCTMFKPSNQLPIGQRRQAGAHSARSFIRVSKQEPDDADMVDWKLCDSTVHSNLGNMGPDSGDAEIRYSNVWTSNGEGIDLVVTNTTEYSASSVTNNGRKDCFGLINVFSPSTVSLTLRFVSSGTNDLVELGRSFFTIYDIDESKKGMQEQISFNTAVSSYYLMPNSELETSSIDGALTFTSTVVGTGGDNPSDPETLTSEQEARAITVEYSNIGEYTLTFSAIGDATKKVSGRNFLFAGKSDLTEDAPETSCEESSCEVWADPHVSGFDNAAKGPIAFIGGYMSTFDRQPVDVNAYETGDFWLVKSVDVQIQGRYKLSKEFRGGRAAVGALAVGGSFIGGFKLIVEPKSGTIEWNGNQLGENSKFELGNASIPVVVETYYNASHDRGTAPSGVDVSLPHGVFLRVWRYNTHLDLKITATERLDAVDGQCGNFNGDARDDSLEHIKGRMHVLTVAPQDSLFSS